MVVVVEVVTVVRWLWWGGVCDGDDSGDDCYDDGGGCGIHCGIERCFHLSMLTCM